MRWMQRLGWMAVAKMWYFSEAQHLRRPKLKWAQR